MGIGSAGGTETATSPATRCPAPCAPLPASVAAKEEHGEESWCIDSPDNWHESVSEGKDRGVYVKSKHAYRGVISNQTACNINGSVKGYRYNRSG
jgi:hypothetical protein